MAFGKRGWLGCLALVALTACQLPRAGEPALRRPATIGELDLHTDAALDERFTAEIARIDQRVAGELGIGDEQRAVGVADLANLRTAWIRPDAMFRSSGGVSGMGVALAYFANQPDAAASLDPEIAADMQRSLKLGDDAATGRIAAAVGGEKIREALASPALALYDPQTGGLWYGRDGGGAPASGPAADLLEAASVRQCLRFFTLLEQGRAVSEPASAALREMMAAPALEWSNDGVVRGLNGRDVVLLRCGGRVDDWRCEAARVQHGRSAYLLACMARHARAEEYVATMAAEVDRLLFPDERPPLPAHRLSLHEMPADFSAGRLARAALDPFTNELILCPTASADTVYESPPLTSEMLFNEALLSWNIEAPGATAFCVELRVGRKQDDSWSAWHYMGDWGGGPAWPPADRTIESAAGRVDVDIFRSERRFDRVQYRIRAARSADVLSFLRVRRIGICLSDTSGIPLSAPRAWRPPAQSPAREQWQRRLAVPFRSQQAARAELASRICSPASLAMVLEYRGIVRRTEEVAALCLDPLHDIYGNWTRNVQAAFSLGAPGYLTRFSDWDAVQAAIAANQPLIISIRVDEAAALPNAPYSATDGHLLVLVGFNAAGDVEVNDPAARSAAEGETVYPRAALEDAWMRNAGGVAYVIEPPARREEAPADGARRAGPSDADPQP